MNKKSRIYIAGHRGLVGSALVRAFRDLGYTNIITRTHAELDLTDQKDTYSFFQDNRPEYVFLAAAKVGGILANNTYPAEFIYQNLAIQNNIIHASWKCGVKRLLFLGSSCIYPRECPQPIREEYLLTGPLEPTNRPYAIAKISGVEMCWAYNRQYGTRYLAVMPTNLYGPGDCYDLKNSHVIPAVLRKLHLAKLSRAGHLEAIRRDEAVIGPIPEDVKKAIGLSADSTRLTGDPHALFWGTGRARREFLYSEDMVDACMLLVGLSDREALGIFSEKTPPLINIGCGWDLTIRELVDLVNGVVGFEGEIRWDTGKPDGTMQKKLDVGRLTRLGWRPQVELVEGIGRVYQDYRKSVASSGE